MSKTALQTVQSFQMSLGSGTTEWMDLVSDHITFKGPVDQVSGKQKFIELNQAFFPMVRDYKPLNAFENGNFVCLEGTFKVASPKGKEKTNLDRLMARIGEDAISEALERKGCKPMDITGRPMKGFVFVTPEGFDLDRDLEHWVQLAIDFNPFAKSSKRK